MALAIAVVAGIVALAQRYQGYTSGTELGAGRMLGRGPYTTTACQPSHELVQQLADTLDELREERQVIGIHLRVHLDRRRPVAVM